MSWLSGWSYRRAITITEQSGGTLTDYQVRIELNSSNFDFSKANSDGSDIRFTADDGETLLPYWIEKWDDVNEEAIIWVKVPSIPANGEATIYMYYGNPSAVSESNGEAVFEFFDDFEGTSLDTNKWNNDGGTITIANSILTFYSGTGSGYSVYSVQTFSRPIVLRVRTKIDNPNAGVGGHAKRVGFSNEATVSSKDTALFVWSSADGVYRTQTANEGALTHTNFDATIFLNWFTGEIVWHDTTKVEFYKDDNLISTHTSNVPNEALPINILTIGDGYIYVDWVAVRKYAEQEPTASVGSEETLIKAWDGSQWKDIKAIYYWNGSSWVKAKGAYYWDGSQWVQFWVGPLRFGDVVRSASSPGTYPYGIGGDSTVIWHCDRDTRRVYELSTTDFSVVRSASSPSTNPSGIGGDSSAIRHCDLDADKVYELSTTDFSVVRSANSPSGSPYGIGGDSTVIWHCDAIAIRVYELSTTDFSVVRSASSPSTYPRGIGGDSTVIWHCDIIRVYELSTTDFSVVRSANSPNGGASGIGGDSSVIWHCDWNVDKVYELSTG